LEIGLTFSKEGFFTVVYFVFLLLPDPLNVNKKIQISEDGLLNFENNPQFDNKIDKTKEASIIKNVSSNNPNPPHKKIKNPDCLSPNLLKLGGLA
jgi:hypothetical protein